MPANLRPRGAHARDAKTGAGFGLATAASAAALFLYPIVFPSGDTTVQQQLATFTAARWETILTLNVLVILFALPFAAYLRVLLEGRSPGAAHAASALFMVGIVLAEGAEAFQAVAMFTLAGTYNAAGATAADRAAAVLAASVLDNVTATVFPDLLAVAGVALFSAAMLDSRVVGNATAAVGFVTAAALLVVLGLRPLSSVPAAGLQVAGYTYEFLYLAWLVGSSGSLIRSSRPAPGKAAVPA